MSLDRFFGQPLQVVNIGLEMFAEELRADGVPVVQVDWRPPAGGNPRVAELLRRLDAIEREKP
ncbi:MAG: fdrA domain protein [bacterium]|nr:fdrA domain protein [bacterium]